MKNIIIAVLSLLYATNLSAQKQKNEPTLKGTLSRPTKASKVYLLYQYEGKKVIDSATINALTFKFRIDEIATTLATLVLDHDGKGFKSLLKQPVNEVDALKFYLYPAGIELKLTDSISTAVFINSGVNQDYTQLKTLLNINAEHKLYALSARMQKTRSPEDEKIYATYYDSLKASRSPILKKYVMGHPKSYMALVALEEYAGPFPDIREIRTMFNAIDPGIRNSMEGQKFKMLLDSKVVIGKLAPDFTQNNTIGKPVSLSSFRGKFVLVDFWASWCAPCRQENPRLVKVYNELKGKNFTILGISADGEDTKAAWIKAIKDDGLAWTQLSDLKHWSNSAVVLYGIRGIPQNVLIDPEGVVLAKNIEPEEIGGLIKRAKEKK